MIQAEYLKLSDVYIPLLEVCPASSFRWDLPCPFLLGCYVILKHFQGGCMVHCDPLCFCEYLDVDGGDKTHFIWGSSHPQNTALSRRNVCKALCKPKDKNCTAEKNHPPLPSGNASAATTLWLRAGWKVKWMRAELRYLELFPTRWGLGDGLCRDRSIRSCTGERVCWVGRAAWHGGHRPAWKTAPLTHQPKAKWAGCI